MKKIIAFSLFLFVFMVGCEDDAVRGPNELGGETNIPLTKVGNTYSVSVSVGETFLDIGLDTAYISKNDNGIVTVKIKGDISKVDPALRAIIPARFLDGNGNVDAEIYFKATSEGIQDFYYSNGDFSKPFTIVKYDMSTGTTWSYTTSDGTTINRTVTEKTGLDDWPFGFMYIKTTKVESNNPGIDGVSKVTFRANHRFGLVYVEYVLVNGEIVKLYLHPLADL